MFLMGLIQGLYFHVQVVLYAGGLIQGHRVSISILCK